MKQRIEPLVNFLKTASHRYYNGDVLLLDNVSYDGLIKELRIADPANPFLKTIGKPPLKSLCLLPAPIPQPSPQNPPIIYEHHDGLPALWCPARNSLYLLADERRGKNIRAIVPHIKGLIYDKFNNWMIRGTLILPKRIVKDPYEARVKLNQLIYTMEIDPYILSNIWFIPHQVISPKYMRPQQQLKWLSAQGFQVPWWKQLVEGESASLYYHRRPLHNAFHIKGVQTI